MLGVALDESKKPIENPVDREQPIQIPLPFGPDDIGMTVTPVKDEDARAMIGDIMARIPEHRDQAWHDLQQLAADPTNNEVAHRGLAREYLRQKKFDAAADELEKAAEANPQDPWLGYYRSALKYQKAQATGQQMQGLANMMQDLRSVTDWYPEMADAYNMLGMARVEGGGINSALEAQKEAIVLSPRNAEYQFNLGQIYVSGKKWDLARDVFTRLRAGPDRTAAAAAKQQLADLDTLQKYGVRPQRAAGTETPDGAASAPSVKSNEPPATATTTHGQDEDADSEADANTPLKPAPVQPGPTGPVQFLKGKIVSSDCSNSPAAIVTILSGMTTYKMHTSNYKSLVVMGEDQFSCDWKNRLVSVNYRAAGKHEGELVSIEVR
jgi:thioredoxin-like negative regulator of GroEL